MDVVILSAGYGLISEQRAIAPYEVTFNTMKGREIDEWAEVLKIHEEFEKIVESYDLVFFLLGENYLRALSLPVKTEPSQTFIFLASKGSLPYIQELKAKTFILQLSNAEAKRYSYGLVGLKGFLFKQFAEVAKETPQLLERVTSVPEYFEEIINKVGEGANTPEESVQLELPLGLPQASSSIITAKFPINMN
ncbi:DUF6884 domain-containing protein [Capilliphycus salinus ALCB114379]|uniref:DUF6884 domain-containing protein n=1 Tax=Capilliphycus salinus TaxID=2768948 RepID=UPI0039A4B880